MKRFMLTILATTMVAYCMEPTCSSSVKPDQAKTSNALALWNSSTNENFKEIGLSAQAASSSGEHGNPLLALIRKSAERHDRKQAELTAILQARTAELEALDQAYQERHQSKTEKRDREVEKARIGMIASTSAGIPIGTGLMIGGIAFPPLLVVGGFLIFCSSIIGPSVHRGLQDKHERKLTKLEEAYRAQRPLLLAMRQKAVAALLPE